MNPHRLKPNLLFFEECSENINETDAYIGVTRNSGRDPGPPLNDSIIYGRELKPQHLRDVGKRQTSVNVTFFENPSRL